MFIKSNKHLNHQSVPISEFLIYLRTLFRKVLICFIDAFILWENQSKANILYLTSNKAKLGFREHSSSHLISFYSHLLSYWKSDIYLNFQHVVVINILIHLDTASIPIILLKWIPKGQLPNCLIQKKYSLSWFYINWCSQSNFLWTFSSLHCEVTILSILLFWHILSPFLVLIPASKCRPYSRISYPILAVSRTSCILILDSSVSLISIYKLDISAAVPHFRLFMLYISIQVLPQIHTLKANIFSCPKIMFFTLNSLFFFFLWD